MNLRSPDIFVITYENYTLNSNQLQKDGGKKLLACENFSLIANFTFSLKNRKYVIIKKNRLSKVHKSFKIYIKTKLRFTIIALSPKNAEISMFYFSCSQNGDVYLLQLTKINTAVA